MTAKKQKSILRSRGHLLTEQRLVASRNLDELSTAAAFDVLNDEDQKIAMAVRRAKKQIVAAIDLVVEAWQSGGRLIYMGAGTSGRLGVLDAAECPPTFRSPPRMVQAIIAGGRRALVRAVEGAENSRKNGIAEIRRLKVTAADAIFGIATGGTTPFVHAALEEAARRRAKTIFLACVDKKHVTTNYDVDIRVLTGPEALTGSTRMKAGLATKMVLNSISTLAMVRMGKVYENLMVDLNTFACAKLVDRANRVLMELTGINRFTSELLLLRTDGQVKPALLMAKRGIGIDEAQRCLRESNGHIRQALSLQDSSKPKRRRLTPNP